MLQPPFEHVTENVGSLGNMPSIKKFCSQATVAAAPDLVSQLVRQWPLATVN